MPVLVLLILMDIAVMGLIMYAVMREKPKHITTTHPYVTEAQKNAQAASATENTETKAE